MPPPGRRGQQLEGRNKESGGGMDENMDKDLAMAILAAVP
jgi:hypothetical protein